MNSDQDEERRKALDREMRESLRTIEGANYPRTYGNTKFYGRLSDGFAMLRGVDPIDYEADEVDA